MAVVHSIKYKESHIFAVFPCANHIVYSRFEGFGTFPCVFLSASWGNVPVAIFLPGVDCWTTSPPLPYLQNKYARITLGQGGKRILMPSTAFDFLLWNLTYILMLTLRIIRWISNNNSRQSWRQLLKIWKEETGVVGQSQRLWDSRVS